MRFDRVLIGTFPSSDGSKTYEMYRGKDGVVYCSCPGWKFSKERPRSCKHMKTHAETLVREGEGENILDVMGRDQ